jgi:hypothetical protein
MWKKWKKCGKSVNIFAENGNGAMTDGASDTRLTDDGSSLSSIFSHAKQAILELLVVLMNDSLPLHDPVRKI